MRSTQVALKDVDRNAPIRLEGKQRGGYPVRPSTRTESFDNLLNSHKQKIALGLSGTKNFSRLTCPVACSLSA
jgi:hypothetical protein